MSIDVDVPDKAVRQFPLIQESQQMGVETLRKRIAERKLFSIGEINEKDTDLAIDGNNDYDLLTDNNQLSASLFANEDATSRI